MHTRRLQAIVSQAEPNTQRTRPGKWEAPMMEHACM